MIPTWPEILHTTQQRQISESQDIPFPPYIAQVLCSDACIGAHLLGEGFEVLAYGSISVLERMVWNVQVVTDDAKISFLSGLPIISSRGDQVLKFISA